MPRKAREKAPDCIYHIICRSISEFLLFRDDADKDKYLELLKRYKEIYKCSIYAYCLMDNHLHLHLDPRGFDVSTFMKSINGAYAYYYNKKYERHGHVFQSRFESRILATDEYNLTLSAYIHNNPHDIEKFCGKEESYKYSSYGIYLGLRNDKQNIVDKSFVLGLFNTTDEEVFAKRYSEFVSHQRDIGSYRKLKKSLSSAVVNEYRDVRKVILRDHVPSKVLSFIADKLMVSQKGALSLKAKHKLIDFRAFCAYSMRILCGLGYKEICSSMYNMTLSGCSRLCSKGYELVYKNTVYKDLFDELINMAA